MLPLEALRSPTRAQNSGPAFSLSSSLPDFSPGHPPQTNFLSLSISPRQVSNGLPDGKQIPLDGSGWNGQMTTLGQLQRRSVGDAGSTIGATESTTEACSQNVQEDTPSDASSVLMLGSQQASAFAIQSIRRYATNLVTHKPAHEASLQFSANFNEVQAQSNLSSPSFSLSDTVADLPPQVTRVLAPTSFGQPASLGSNATLREERPALHEWLDTLQTDCQQGSPSEAEGSREDLSDDQERRRSDMQIAAQLQSETPTRKVSSRLEEKRRELEKTARTEEAPDGGDGEAERLAFRGAVETDRGVRRGEVRKQRQAQRRADQDEFILTEESETDEEEDAGEDVEDVELRRRQLAAEFRDLLRAEASSQVIVLEVHSDDEADDQGEQVLGALDLVEAVDVDHAIGMLKEGGDGRVHSGEEEGSAGYFEPAGGVRFMSQQASETNDEAGGRGEADEAAEAICEDLVELEVPVGEEERQAEAAGGEEAGEEEGEEEEAAADIPTMIARLHEMDLRGKWINFKWCQERTYGGRLGKRIGDRKRRKGGAWYNILWDENSRNQIKLSSEECLAVPLEEHAQCLQDAVPGCFCIDPVDLRHAYERIVQHAGGRKRKGGFQKKKVIESVKRHKSRRTEGTEQQQEVSGSGAAPPGRPKKVAADSPATPEKVAADLLASEPATEEVETDFAAEASIDVELFKALILSDPEVLCENQGTLLINRLDPNQCANMIEGLKHDLDEGAATHQPPAPRQAPPRNQTLSKDNTTAQACGVATESGFEPEREAVAGSFEHGEAASASGARNTVSRVCFDCAKRKMGCDGRRPCSRCIKRGNECVDQQFPMIRLTKKRVKKRRRAAEDPEHSCYDFGAPRASLSPVISQRQQERAPADNERHAYPVAGSSESARVAAIETDRRAEDGVRSDGSHADSVQTSIETPGDADGCGGGQPQEERSVKAPASSYYSDEEATADAVLESSYNDTSLDTSQPAGAVVQGRAPTPETPHKAPGTPATPRTPDTPPAENQATAAIAVEEAGPTAVHSTEPDAPQTTLLEASAAHSTAAAQQEPVRPAGATLKAGLRQLKETSAAKIAQKVRDRERWAARAVGQVAAFGRDMWNVPNACQVCFSSEGSVITCDGCGCRVHPACYGLDLDLARPAPAPVGITTRRGAHTRTGFRCHPCSEEAVDAARVCVLCPEPGGALKRTSDGRYAHVACATFCPGVFEDGEVVAGLERLPRKSWTTRCLICGTNGGAALECQAPLCRVSFHVGCALRRSVAVRLELSCEGDRMKSTVLCARHAVGDAPTA